MLLVFVSLCAQGCSRATNGSAAASSAPSPTPDAIASPALEYKPGSRAAAILDQLQKLKVEKRQDFKDFLVSYELSKGNVQFPRLARFKKWLIDEVVLTDADYTKLPGYMKVFAGTGPYRRLISKPGFSYVAGSVFLPCKAAHLNPKFETAFAYLGGWGAGKAGKAVDAGFQRSDKFDNYSLFVLAQDFPQISKFPRFECGHSVDFKFYAASDTQLRLWAKGVTAGDRNQEVVEAVLEHPKSYGWPADGGGSATGIVLKRMTTIGQADADANLPPGTAWNANGSYFGHYAQERQPRVRWLNLAIGRVDAKGNPIDVRPWGVHESNLALHAGMVNYPSDPRNIWYTCTACPDESNAINLAGGKP